MERSDDLHQLRRLMLPGQLILIAGRLGLGKSFLACDMLCSSPKFGTGAYVSVSRGRESVEQRFAALGKSPSLIFDNGEDSLENALQTLGALQLPLSGLVFDTIAGEDHERAAAQIVELKSLAARFKAPVIALADVPKFVDQRKDRKPQLRDLPIFELLPMIDSVILMYSDEYYTAEPVTAVEAYVPKSPFGAFSVVCRWREAPEEQP